jgi:hypothetical protein
MNADESRRRLLTLHVRNAMIKRCTKISDPAYKNYGGRGITVCNRWLESPQNFIDDMGIKPDGYSIERIDNSKGYEPRNCTWIPRKLQNRNRRNCVMFCGMTLKELWTTFGHPSVTYRRAATRVQRDGYSPLKAVYKPTKNKAQ